jgi:precorrin-2 dehydrogenase / sirohydrochlorin ferrochelatase
LKQKLQAEIGPEYGELLALFRSLRVEITTRIPDFGARRDLWYRLMDGECLELLRQGKREEAERAARQLVEEAFKRTISSTSRSDTSGDNGHR